MAVLLTSDVVDAGLISSAVGGGVCAGEFLFMIASTWGGHLKWKLVFVTVCLTAFISGVAGATENKATAAALATLGGVSVGGLELLCATLITIIIDDQSEMGCAIGVYGSIRSAAGVIASKLEPLHDLPSALTRKLLSCRLRCHPGQQSCFKYHKHRGARHHQSGTADIVGGGFDHCVVFG